MQLHSIKAAYTTAMTLYGVTPDPQEFEDIAMVAWELINARHTKLYRFISDTSNNELELPCNCYAVESVHIPLEDAQMTSNKTIFNSVETLFVENYIEAWKRLDDPYYHRGKLVKYKEGNNTLYFSRNYKRVMTIYQGYFVDDEDGLPLVNDKEIHAIAAYVAYTMTFRDALKFRDNSLVQLAQILKAEWLKLCNSARIPDHLSQNDMNSILDVKTR